MELRDGDGSRYGGKGVLLAVSEISDKGGTSIAGTVVTEQRRIDQRMLELDLIRINRIWALMPSWPCR